LLPAIILVYAVVPFRFSWAVIALIGAFELWLGVSTLRHRRSSPLGWLMLAIGIAAIGAAAYLSLTPLGIRTI
jgi:hypothetical protein